MSRWIVAVVPLIFVLVALGRAVSGQNTVRQALALRDKGESQQAIALLEDATRAVSKVARPCSAVEEPIENLGLLYKLYVAAGDAEKAYRTRIRMYEIDECRLTLSSFDGERRTIEAAGFGDVFRTWMRERLSRVETPAARAALWWALGDAPQAFSALEQHIRGNPRYFDSSSWMERANGKGRPTLIACLRAMVRANPTDDVLVIQLLDLEDRWEGPQLERALENLIAGPGAAYSRFYSTYGSMRSKISSPWQAGSRLASLYYRRGATAQLLELAGSVASARKPFHQMDIGNGREEASDILSLAISRASTPEEFAALEKALANPMWETERRLLQRARGASMSPRKPFGWTHVPDGVRVLASNESVLDLVVTNRHIITGHPWGVAIYNLHGQPITRIATGSPALHVRVAGDVIWTASQEHLVRILDQSIVRFPIARITELQLEGDRVLIRTEGAVQSFEPETGELRDSAHAPQQTANERRRPPFERDSGIFWKCAVLPDKTSLFGRVQPSTYQWIYPTSELYQRFERFIPRDDRDGLHRQAADGSFKRLSDGFSDALRGDSVFDVIAGDDGTKWILTSHGLTRLDAGDNVIDTLTESDGLPDNRVRAGTLEGGKLFLAGGERGVTVVDPKRMLARSLSEADGLPSSATLSIRATSAGLEVTFASKNDRRPAPHLLDPLRERFTPSPTPEVPGPQPANEQMPILGGYVIARRTFGGREYLAGTRGLVIVDKGARLPRPPRMAMVKVIEQANEDEALIAAARPFAGKELPVNREQVKRLLQNENPYLVAEVLFSYYGGTKGWDHQYTPIVAPLTTHRVLPLRAAAVLALWRSKDPAAASALTRALTDSELPVRALAAIALAELGHPPSLTIFREILEGDGPGEYPSSARGSYGVIASRERGYAALAKQPTIDSLRLLIEFAPYPELLTEIAPVLGTAIAKDPNLAEPFLHARDAQPYWTSRVDLARLALASAGRPMLPRLHEALRSQDPYVRSNAARALGTLRDPSSITPLMSALDLWHGVPRRSIVWALAELNAKEAVPHLIELYGETLASFNDERKTPPDEGEGAGEDARYRTWDAILDALERIEDPRLQAFYRRNSATIANRAAVQLARGTGSDIEKNKAVLAELLGRANEEVSIAAAVSLIILDVPAAARPRVLAALSGQSHLKRSAVEQLARVSDPRKLLFARDALRAIVNDVREREETRTGASQLLARIPA